MNLKPGLSGALGLQCNYQGIVLKTHPGGERYYVRGSLLPATFWTSTRLFLWVLVCGFGFQKSFSNNRP